VQRNLSGFSALPELDGAGTRPGLIGIDSPNAARVQVNAFVNPAGSEQAPGGNE
jgi:hypothetical protein